MADDITNGMILEHMHAMKYDLLQKIQGTKDDLLRQMLIMKNDLQRQIYILDAKVDKGFEEARQHRQTLQEDLEATMRMLSKHETKLARLTRAGSK